MTKPSSVLIAVSLALCGLAACARDPIVLDEADFDLRFEPGVLDLGAAAPGAASRATAQLVNRGSISVRLAQAPRLEHVDLGFSVSALLPDAIAPGASHPIEIIFTAAGAEGRRDTALALAYAVGEQARPLRLTLRGVVTASPDAGFPPDATASAADAASTPDAGVVPDATTAPADGGAPDATAPPPDASAPPDAGAPPSVCTSGAPLFPVIQGPDSPASVYAAPPPFGGESWTFDGREVSTMLGGFTHFDGERWTNHGLAAYPYRLSNTLWGRSRNEVWLQTIGDLLRFDADTGLFSFDSTWMATHLSGDTSGSFAWALDPRMHQLRQYGGGTWFQGPSLAALGRPDAVVSRGQNEVWVAYNDRTVHRWDGTSFTPLALAPGSGRSVTLANAGSEVWLLWAGDSAGGDTVYSTTDGLTWTPRRGATNARLNSISATAPDDVWVVGDAFIEHWNGRTWEVPVGACSQGPRGELFDVQAFARGQAVVTGATFDHATVSVWNGQDWRHLVENEDNIALEAVSTLSSAVGWAAGSGGRIYQLRGGSWVQPLRIASGARTHGVQAISRTEAWVANERGLFHIQGGTAALAQGAPTGPYSAVRVDGSGNVWATGEAGLVVRCTAGVCADVSPPSVTGDLHSLSVSPSGSVWVSSTREIAVYDGAWRTQPAPSGSIASLTVADRPYALVGGELRAWRASDAQWVPIALPTVDPVNRFTRLRTVEGAVWVLGTVATARNSASGFVPYAMGAVDAASSGPGTGWLAMTFQLVPMQY